MKSIAPAGWVAILVFVVTVMGCAAMIYISQSNQWSPISSTRSADAAELEQSFEHSLKTIE